MSWGCYFRSLECRSFHSEMGSTQGGKGSGGGVSNILQTKVHTECTRLFEMDIYQTFINFPYIFLTREISPVAIYSLKCVLPQFTSSFLDKFYKVSSSFFILLEHDEWKRLYWRHTYLMATATNILLVT